MFLNLMGKRLQYEKRFTNEVRQSLHHRYEFFYWQKVLKKHFPCVDVTDWGVKLPFSVDVKFASLNNIFELANLCKELYRIENGSKCVNDFDWYTIVKNDLDMYDAEALKIDNDIKSFNEKLERETEGMNLEQIWEWIGNHQDTKHYSDGNEEKHIRKIKANMEMERRWEMKKAEARQRTMERLMKQKSKSEKPKSKPKAVSKPKVKMKPKEKVEGQMKLF